MRLERDRDGSLESRLSADGTRPKLVNSGQDTEIVFEDGSSLVLKGITHPEVFFWPPSRARP